MGSKAPEAPDPYAVADAQTKQNITTAKAQQQLGMTGAVGPTGSKQYVLDPSSPSGYREITSFSPEMQALFDQGTGLQALSGSIIGDRLGRIGERGDFDMDAGRGLVLSDIERTMMDPLWQSKSEQFDTQMRNEGIMPGSEAYATRKRQFDQGQSDAYNQMFLRSYGMANDAAMKEWQMPMSELQQIVAMRAGQPVPQTPQFGGASGPGVAPVDLTSLVNQQYQAQMQQANASMGGLYGLGAAGLGGWASAGFPGAGALIGMISDRRLKADIELIGHDPRGWGIYEFRYVWGPKVFIGFMADEVEAVRPDCVITHPNGTKAINYDRLGASNGG